MMGSCWCKDSSDGSGNNGNPDVDSLVESPATHTVVIDALVLDLLKIFYVIGDNDEDSPVALTRLHAIAEQDEGWIAVVKSMINVIPDDDPFGASAITILFDDCPLPNRDTVIILTDQLQLSEERISQKEVPCRVERNICIVLGCIAEKLAGPNSVSILNDNTLGYLFAMINCDKPSVVLFALIALEKFALTTENKMTIKKRIEASGSNPLLRLEKFYNSDDCEWRQVGFCAQWMLDNMFVLPDRTLTYQAVDMSNINVILNSKDVSEYLKISADGLEARCDSYSFESVRGTFQVDTGVWMYECTIITPGVMQIGWATRNSHFLNHEGYGIGDDLFSISYDGCRRLMWHKARPSSQLINLPPWKPGDTLGCLIDVGKREMLFYLNGKKLPTCKELFQVTRTGYFAAASFMAFQQCRFNFGHEPFKFPPEREFNSFNSFGQLTPEEKVILPRRLFLQQLLGDAGNENSCSLCCDERARITLLPCGHKGYCDVCASRLRKCPMCRTMVLDVVETHIERFA